jgi:hypothetical protein
MNLLARFLDWVSNDRADDRQQFDHQYIRQLDYDYLETNLEIEGQDYVRCNLCGRLYDFKNINIAFEHIAKHNGQGEASINPFHSIKDRPVPVDENVVDPAGRLNDD